MSSVAVLQPRPVKAAWKSQPTVEGAGVRLRRAVGHIEPIDLDPFLLMDDFRCESPDQYLPGFPWHPHRGIETITYVLDGDVEHGDSLGNGGVISAGDVQWMTAGSGIIHQEMPKGTADGRMYGFQLWANLPRANKMMDPRYRDVRSGTIPEVKLASGATVRVISGEVEGVRGPVQDIVIDPEYLHVTLPAGTAFTHPVKPGHNVFAYVIAGEGYFGGGADEGGLEAGTLCDDRTVVAWDKTGDAVSVVAEAKPVQFLLVSGKPLGEPVAWHGPIVMNTRDELRTAFRELNHGTFIKRS